MKKIFITTALALSAVTFAFAEGGVTVTASTTTTTKVRTADQGRPSKSGRSENRSGMASSTDTLGAQIKSLNMEMEAKIKAIREDYRAKIKALIASSTPMMRGRDDVRASSTENNHASSSEDRTTDRGRRGGEVKGVEVDNTQTVQGGALMQFFRGIFGNN